MSDSKAVPPPKDASSFANFLASFTSSPQGASQSRDDPMLPDDIATISYEQALRSHRRVDTTGYESTSSPVQDASDYASPTSAPLPTPAGKKRKTASITIRLTDAEQAQLHERAAAAQLSISAYLRSCIFEAESLRTQVKDALSQIRASAHADPSHQPQSQPPSSWRTRLLPHWLGRASQ